MIDHTQQKTLPLAVTDLVNADPAQPSEAVGAPCHLRHDPDHDCRHRPPGNPL
jgi:hypothetical protein